MAYSNVPSTNQQFYPRPNRLYHSTSASPSTDGLSAGAAAASAAMAEGYAQLNAVTGADENVLDYRQLMGLVYPNIDNTYTHVDPTQILSVNTSGPFPPFHTSRPARIGTISILARTPPQNHTTLPTHQRRLPQKEPSTSSRTPAPRKFISLQQGAQGRAAETVAQLACGTQVAGKYTGRRHKDRGRPDTNAVYQLPDDQHAALETRS